MQRKLIGTSPKRLEDPRLLRGDGRYLADIKLHGMLHAAVLRSPTASGRIVSIDTAAARRLPGVVDVLTATDLPPFPGLPCFSAPPDSPPFFQPVLAAEVMRYVGEPVAIVVARTRHEAEDALGAIEMRWEDLPAVVSPERALQPGAPLVHADTNVAAELHFAQGDAGLIDRASHRLRRRFRLQRQAGIPLETRGVAAEWDTSRERLTIWASTQCPHVIRDFAAMFCGLPPAAVRVLVPDVGGAFGTKNNLYPEDLAIPLLAHRLRRPVKWVEDRAEHLAAAAHGREQIHDVEVAYEDDGTIVGLRDRVIMPCGAYLSMLAHEEIGITLFMLRGPYRIPNYSGDGILVATHTTPLTPFRAVGFSQAVFVMERLIEEIAAERGIDPVQLRLHNMAGPGELPLDRGIATHSVGPIVYDSGDYPEALRRVLALADYDELRAEQARLREQGRHLGIGIASYMEVTSIGPFETGTTRVDTAGQVEVGTGTTGSGQGHTTAFAQIAADELGVRMEDVRVIAGDTDRVRTGMGAYASRSAAVAGTAIRRSAAVVRAKALQVAAHMLEASVEDLVLDEGRISVAGSPQVSVSLGEVAAAVAPGAPLPPGIDSHELQAADHFVPPAAGFPYGTQVAVVEVDVETGEVKLLRIALVHDAGPLINPAIVQGQLYGGIVLGVGTALVE
ncbi:MAG TPA: xanthine dehydrogenase family protein molybdopterin-binding subunit, partial [Gaiellales bacterium]|nr:xanthine dehydrogenase family protein molybdopterin-binding subunit [Gaiellales bacterium]